MLRTRVAHVVLGLIVSLYSTCVCKAAEPDLQEDIERVLFEEGLTGIAWTLVDETGDITVGAAGLQDNLSRVAFSSDTRLHVGSLTKTVLATGVLRLATEGLLDLDTPALSYLPGLFADDPPAGFSDITVRHLLDHTAGLNDASIWQMFSERATPNAPLIAAFPDPQRQLQVRSEPGSRFSYSNMGYTLLAMIIEAVVDTRYEEYLDEHLLAPLAMHDSTFAFTTQEGGSADPTLAWGHVDDGSRYAAIPIFLRPAGQFTTTTGDMARFAQFLIGDGTVDGQVFVDEALIRSRGKPFGTEAASGHLRAGYSLGLGRRDRHGVVGYCHGGNIVGFVAMLCVFPDEHKAFAYSVNTDSETADYGRFNDLFIAALDIDDASAPRTVSPAPDISEWFGRYVLSPNRFQAFEYLDTVLGAIRISKDGEMLVMTSIQRDARHLRPVGDHLYSAHDRATASHVFLRGDDNEYLISDGFVTYEKVPAVYLALHWISILLGLAGLVWILIVGSITLIRHRSRMIRRPEAPAFFATLLLLVPIPFFLTQSFMALGDVTPASVLLAVATSLLPVGLLSTIILVRKRWRDARVHLLHGAAAICALQWCAVLMAAGMLPLRLWV